LPSFLHFEAVRLYGLETSETTKGMMNDEQEGEQDFVQNDVPMQQGGDMLVCEWPLLLSSNKSERALLVFQSSDQDFGLGGEMANDATPTIISPNDESVGLMESGGVTSDEEAKPSPPTGMCSCLSVEYYKPYWNVDSEEVMDRLKQAMTPHKPAETTFLQQIQKTPDGYGPFWIGTTLIFAIGASSNLQSWLGFQPKPGMLVWQYDFQRVTTATSIVYSFEVLPAMAVWFAGKYVQCPLPLIPLVSLYGYSLLPFIPATLLCTFPSTILALLALFGAAAWSLLFIANSLKTLITDHFGETDEVEKKKGQMFLLGIAGVHVLFTLCLKFLFY
jgi:hypothetical protein